LPVPGDVADRLRLLLLPEPQLAADSGREAGRVVPRSRGHVV
jgi:hypothetical protein